MHNTEYSQITSRVNRNLLWNQYGNMSLTTFEGGRDIFVQALTDDGTDATLNEDYSGAATECYWTATTYPAVINEVHFLAIDSSVAQNTVLPDPETYCGLTLTNGIKMRTENAAGDTEVTFISSGCTTEGILALYADAFFSSANTSNATAGNNNCFFAATIDFRKHFGFGLYIPASGKFIVDLEDDFSDLAAHYIKVSGFYLVTGDQVS